MPNIDLSNLITADEPQTRRIRIPLGGIIYAVILMVIGATLLGIAQTYGHLLPSNICYTFANGDRPCYNSHLDHAKVGYF